MEPCAVAPSMAWLLLARDTVVVFVTVLLLWTVQVRNRRTS